MKVLLVFAVCMLCVYGKVTPDYFPQCKRSDPQIEKCVLEAVETLRPRLKTGIPEIHIPQLEPFSLPTLKLDRNIPNLRLKAVIKNVKAIGGSNFKIEKLRIHLNNKYAAEVKLLLPRISVSGEYDARGSRLLALDINGKGRLHANFTGITVVAKGSAKPVERDGVQYLQADKIITKVRINHGQIAIEDTERPLAAASAVSFFNASPGVVLDILNPLIEESGAAILKTYVNKVLATVPLAEVLADRK